MTIWNAEQFKNTLPAFINIYTAAPIGTWVGVDGLPEWDRLSIVREELEKWDFQANPKDRKDIIAEMENYGTKTLAETIKEITSSF